MQRLPLSRSYRDESVGGVLQEESQYSNMWVQRDTPTKASLVSAPSIPLWKLMESGLRGSRKNLFQINLINFNYVKKFNT